MKLCEISFIYFYNFTKNFSITDDQRSLFGESEVKLNNFHFFESYKNVSEKIKNYGTKINDKSVLKYI